MLGKSSLADFPRFFRAMARLPGSLPAPFGAMRKSQGRKSGERPGNLETENVTSPNQVAVIK
jgi:hypothetical protein